MHRILATANIEQVRELLDEMSRTIVQLPRNIQRDLDRSEAEWVSDGTYEQLARWCDPYQDSSREQTVRPIAREVRRLLFGRVITRHS